MNYLVYAYLLLLLSDDCEASEYLIVRGCFVRRLPYRGHVFELVRRSDLVLGCNFHLYVMELTVCHESNFYDEVDRLSRKQSFKLEIIRNKQF